jgi:hypothetical protein
MTFYVKTILTYSGPVDMTAPIEIVAGRAVATEFRRSDAFKVQKRAQERWADREWEIERTYSGKYVVRDSKIYVERSSG